MNGLQNHVVDPTWFDDAIELFAFDYDWYVQAGFKCDELGRRITKFDKLTIRGSLQPGRTTHQFSKDGNTDTMTYDFYCKNIYRITNGDFIIYKNRCLLVDDWNDYDEYGVRSCRLRLVNLNNYKDLKEYLDYLNGDKVR